MANVCNIRCSLVLLLLGAIATGNVCCAPVGSHCNHLDYRVNLASPCGPPSTETSIISTDTELPLPDMAGITANAINAVDNLLEKVVKRLDVSGEELKELQEESWPFKAKVADVGSVEEACQRENDMLPFLWQKLLVYAVFINYMKKYELHYGGYEPSTSGILRSDTFECEMSTLEQGFVSSLLCGFKVVTESKGIFLSDRLIEQLTKQYDEEINIEVSYHTIDKHLYKLLNNLSSDFLHFTNAFFSQC